MMTSLDRTSARPTARSTGRTRVPDQPGSLPAQPARRKGASRRGTDEERTLASIPGSVRVTRPEPAALPVREVLERTLWITTATSEDEVTARAVETAGVVTGATVACAVGPTGSGPVWGEPQLAAALLAESLRSAHQIGQAGGPSSAFAHLGLPDALTATDAGTVLVVATTEPDRFGPEAGTLLALVAAHAAAGRARLRELATLARLADRDPLTGLRHYRPFEERLAASVPERTSVIALDIDNFKQINDVYGHQAGDDALVALVGALRRALRGDDHIYRIGGDEFAVVIEVGSTAELSGVARRLLHAARAVGYPISLGAALCRPGESGRETLLRADRALYQAKRAGRDTAHLAA